MEPADNTRLFFLEDTGVLFHEPAQALYHLNTSAAFIWCLLEDNLDQSEILKRLIGTFDLSREKAGQYYTESEKAFQELGVLKGYETDEYQLVTINPAKSTVDYEDNLFVAEATYTLLSSTIRFRFSDQLQKDLIHPVLGHLSNSGNIDVSSRIDILKDHLGAYTLYRDCIPELSCDSPEKLAPLAKSLVWQTAVNNHDFFLDIHAGVVGDGKFCYLMPGSAGSGKSSLTLALVHQGFEYFSDEVALLHEPDFQVEPVPLASCVKDSGVEPLSSYYPQLLKLKRHLRGDGKRVRYLAPDSNAIPGDNVSRPVGAIIFPRYDDSKPTSLTSLGKVDALKILMQECLIVDTRLDDNNVSRMLEWLEKTPCYRLITTDLEKSVQFVREISRCN